MTTDTLLPIVTVVGASTLIGTAIVLRDSWTRARKVIDLTQHEHAATPSMPAAADDEPICEATEGIWTCTRPPRHEGDHAAHGKDGSAPPVHTWPRKPGEDR